MAGRWARVVTAAADEVEVVEVVEEDVGLVLLDDADVVVDEVLVLLDVVDVVDDAVLELLDDVAVDDVDDAAEPLAFLYSSRRLPAPQYWKRLPEQVKLHSLSGAALLDEWGAWPQ